MALTGRDSATVGAEQMETLGHRIDGVINLPFDIVRPLQVRLSDRLGALALNLKGDGHRIAADFVARCCEVVAIQADNAVMRTFDELQAEQFDPKRVRPDSIDVVPRILAMNEERRQAVA